jgi:hypothetical protein
MEQVNLKDAHEWKEDDQAEAAPACKYKQTLKNRKQFTSISSSPSWVFDKEKKGSAMMQAMQKALLLRFNSKLQREETNEGASPLKIRKNRTMQRKKALSKSITKFDKDKIQA